MPATESQLDGSVRGTPKSGDGKSVNGGDVGSHAPVSPTSSLPSSTSKVSDDVTFRELYQECFFQS